MLRLKNIKIGIKLILIISTMSIVIIAILSFISAYSAQKLAYNNSKEIASQAAIGNSIKVKAAMDAAFSEAKNITKSIETLLKSSKGSISRSQVNLLLKNAIKNNTSFIEIYMGFEPNAFDNFDDRFKNKDGFPKSGRFLTKWIRNEDDTLSRVDVGKYSDKFLFGDWYTKTKKDKIETLIEPRQETFKEKNVLISTYLIPILDENSKFIGACGIDISLDFLSKSKSQIHIFDTDYLSVYSSSGILVAVSEKLYYNIGKSVMDFSSSRKFIYHITQSKSSYRQNTFVVKTESKSQKGKFFYSFGTPIKIGAGKSAWTAVITIDEKEIEAESERLVFLFLIIGIASVFVVVIFVYLIAKSFSKPIVKIVGTAKLIANGDFTIDIDSKRKDEIGQLQGALKNILSKVKDVISDIKNVTVQMASSSEEMSSTTISFSDNARNQAASAEQVTATIEELSAGIDNVAQNSEDQSLKLETLLSTMNQLSAMIHTMEEQISEMVVISENISSRASIGESSLKGMSDSMKKITGSSKQMTTIVKLINDISEQINLLSLNAAIEAARAGDAGKGFAVVADEISKLADATSKSIKDITTLITANNNEIQKGMANVGDTIDIITNIIEDIATIGNQMNNISESMKKQLETNNVVNNEASEVRIKANQISSATSEQKIAITEVVKSVSNISELTQSNAAGSEQMASSSEEIAAMADNLKAKVDFFKVN